MPERVKEGIQFDIEDISGCYSKFFVHGHYLIILPKYDFKACPICFMHILKT